MEKELTTQPWAPFLFASAAWRVGPGKLVQHMLHTCKAGILLLRLPQKNKCKRLNTCYAMKNPGKFSVQTAKTGISTYLFLEKVSTEKKMKICTVRHMKKGKC